MARTRTQLPADGAKVTRDFARAMAALPIAVHTEAANAQHYEVPAEFFGIVLGPRRKYSCCLYERDTATLADAERAALAATAAPRRPCSSRRKRTTCRTGPKTSAVSGSRSGMAISVGGKYVPLPQSADVLAIRWGKRAVPQGQVMVSSRLNREPTPM